MALRELVEVGLLEEVAGLKLKRGQRRGDPLPRRSIVRLRRGMYLEKREWEDWNSRGSEMEGRLGMARKRGRAPFSPSC